MYNKLFIHNYRTVIHLSSLARQKTIDLFLFKHTYF